MEEKKKEKKKIVAVVGICLFIICIIVIIIWKAGTMPTKYIGEWKGKKEFTNAMAYVNITLTLKKDKTYVLTSNAFGIDDNTSMGTTITGGTYTYKSGKIQLINKDDSHADEEKVTGNFQGNNLTIEYNLNGDLTYYELKK